MTSAAESAMDGHPVVAWGRADHPDTVLSPPWRLPVSIVIVSLLAGVALPGLAPAPFFAGVIAAWALAALVFTVLSRRERLMRRHRRERPSNRL
jgi:hypothetical protein